jgi:hypothetical protein
MESGIYVSGGGNLIDKTVEAGEKITNSNELWEIREDAEAFQDLMVIANDLTSCILELRELKTLKRLLI